MALQQSSASVPKLQAQADGTLVFRLDSGYGCLKATGEDTLDLLNRLSTNKVDHLQPGHWAPTVLTSDRGRIVDLLSVIHAGECVYLLTSPGQQQPVIEWLDKYTIMEDLEVEDVSGSTAVIALAGEGCDAALNLEPDGTDRLPGLQYPAPTVNIGGREAIAISHPLGDLPCCLLVAVSDYAAEIGASLESSGASQMDAEAWEALRVANGAPAFGSEMGEPYNPLEAGLIGAIDFTKGCYIGQEVIARLDSYDRVQRYLSVLRFSDGCDVTVGTALFLEGRQAGTVTSVYRTQSGDLRGLGFVRTASANAGQTLELQSPASGTATVEETPKLFGPGQDFS
ncbi:Putative transferase At1g60990, chloroplastic [Geodia barretti]|uniref:Transferase At1g60990, chloroplastic n=1 Tax=Geodia barretti TaxID=519541 RepID=A0AA35T4K2_GEOBA|nr:Putative transferase At1g60990, chloroplastic [Geodia barretti]